MLEGSKCSARFKVRKVFEGIDVGKRKWNLKRKGGKKGRGKRKSDLLIFFFHTRGGSREKTRFVEIKLKGLVGGGR